MISCSLVPLSGLFSSLYVVVVLAFYFCNDVGLHGQKYEIYLVVVYIVDFILFAQK